MVILVYSVSFWTILLLTIYYDMFIKTIDKQYDDIYAIMTHSYKF